VINARLHHELLGSTASNGLARPIRMGQKTGTIDKTSLASTKSERIKG